MFTQKTYSIVHWLLIFASIGFFLFGLLNTEGDEEMQYLIPALGIWILAWTWGKFMKPKD